MSEIKTTKIIGETGVDAVNFTRGLNVTGVSTATNVSVSYTHLTLPTTNRV